MIIKIVKSEKGTRSARGLLKYISQEEKGIEPKLNFNNLDHCTDINSAIAEMEQLQKHNTRVKGEKTLHLVVSFAVGELPDDEALADIEHNIAVELGLGKNQRVSALHTDTDANHLHIAINKIDPDNFKSNNLSYSHTKLSKVASILEKKHGLVQIVRDKSERKILKENLIERWKLDNQQIRMARAEVYDKSKAKVKEIKEMYEGQRRDLRLKLKLAKNNAMRIFYSRQFSEISKNQKRSYEELFKKNQEVLESLPDTISFQSYLEIQAKFKKDKEAQSYIQGVSVQNEMRDKNGNISKKFQFMDSSRIEKKDWQYKTREGDFVYLTDEQRIILSADTKRLTMPKEVKKDSLIRGIEIARSHYGDELSINGTSEFINESIKILATHDYFENVKLKDKEQQKQLEIERELYEHRRRVAKTASTTGTGTPGGGNIGRGYPVSTRSGTGDIIGWNPLTTRRKQRLITSIKQRRRNRELIEFTRKTLAEPDLRDRDRLERIGRSYRAEYFKRKETINEGQREKDEWGRGVATPGREQYLSEVPILNVVHGRHSSEMLLPIHEDDSLELRGQADNGNNAVRWGGDLVRAVPGTGNLASSGINMELIDYINERNDKHSKGIPNVKKHKPLVSLQMEKNEEFIVVGTRKNGRCLLLEKEGDDSIRYAVAVGEYTFNRGARGVGQKVVVSADFNIRFQKQTKKKI